MNHVFIFFTLIISFYCSATPMAQAQCQNEIQFPNSNIQAPINPGDTVIVSSIQAPGDYYYALGFQEGVTYYFETNNDEDFITIRSSNNLDVLAFGNSPLIYTVDLVTDFNVHVNLRNPVCGTIFSTRNSIIHIAEDIVTGDFIGINTNHPESVLDVNGKVKIGDDDSQPLAGMMRWNEETQDFEGYNGEKWMSLTQATRNGGSIHSEAINESWKLTPVDTSFYKEYGSSSDIFEDLAIIGAFRDSINGQYDVGAAYAYKRVNGSWGSLGKIVAVDGEEQDNFGYSVALGDDILAIGSKGATVNAKQSVGSVYMYKLVNDVWVFQSKLTPPYNDSFNYFGNSVAIYGNRLVVGAPGAMNNGIRTGKVYVYTLAGSVWDLEEEIQSSDGVSDSNFGSSVDIFENSIIVGDFTHPNGQLNDVGSAYIYTYKNNNWGGEVKLVDLSGSEEDFYGSSVSIGEEYAVVSSPGKNNSFNFLKGSAFIYSKANNWTEDQMIRVNGPSNETSRFANDIAIDSGILVIGNNYYDRNNKVNQGTCHVFEKNAGGWQEETKFLASDGSAFDRFGSSVCIDNNTVIVGAQLDELILGEKTGSAYIFNYCK